MDRAIPVVINGVFTKVYVSHGHFADVNLLGGLFFEHAHAVLTVDYLFDTVKIAQASFPEIPVVDAATLESIEIESGGTSS